MENGFFEISNTTVKTRTWAEISISALEFNLSQIKKHLPKKTKVMAVVKADGYGHGDCRVAKAFLEGGVDFLAVSNIDEALSLRYNDELKRINPNFDIIILGYTPTNLAELLYKNNITQTVFSSEYANELNELCEREKISVKVHIKLDTGMNRLGLQTQSKEETIVEIKRICSLFGLDVCGVFSHLSSADEEDFDSIEYTKAQKEGFDKIIHALAESDVFIPLSHLQNSAGIAFLYEDSSYDYARAGILLYGVAPSEMAIPFEIIPAMALKSVVSMVKEVKTGSAISYGRRFVAEKPMKIATVPIGYADGYPRLLSNKGYMLIHGKRARILGNICMDQLLLDVSEIDDVKMGDLVTVVGKDGGDEITFAELASMIGTIPYEMMCMIGKRVPRINANQP